MKKTLWLIKISNQIISIILLILGDPLEDTKSTLILNTILNKKVLMI